MSHCSLGNLWPTRIDELSCVVSSQYSMGCAIENPPKGFGLRMM